MALISENDCPLDCSAGRRIACGFPVGRRRVKIDVLGLGGSRRTGRAAVNSCRPDRIDERTVGSRMTIYNTNPAWIALSRYRPLFHDRIHLRFPSVVL